MGYAKMKMLEQRIGYAFRTQALLAEALTHRSFSNEQAGRIEHNERLEFLGDAVLDLIVSDYLFRSFPLLPEGELTRIRAEVVREEGLAAAGREIGLGEFLRLGRGEEKSGGRQKASLLANAMEALLGAVFCDGGIESATPLIHSLFIPAIQRSALRKEGVDHKTRLQEFLQARYGSTPTYVLASMQGPDHDRKYEMEVCFEEKIIGRGRGRT